MTTRTVNADLDSWFVLLTGTEYGSGKGEAMTVGAGSGAFSGWSNRFALRFPRGTLFAGIPSSAAITGFKIKLRAADVTVGIGGTVKFWLEQGSAQFGEGSAVAAPDLVKTTVPVNAKWPGPNVITTNRVKYEGSPAGGEWITVSMLAMGQAWYTSGNADLVLRATAADSTTGYEEGTAARRCTFRTREHASKPYVELTFADEQAPNIAGDPQPPADSKIASMTGTQPLVGAWYSHPENKSGDHYEAAWHNASATDVTPGTPTTSSVVAATLTFGRRLHTFTGLPARTAGRWRMRFARLGLWGPWGLLTTATTAYRPTVTNPAVTPGTLTPDIFASLVSADSADFITAGEVNWYQDPAQGQTITKWASGKVTIGGSPTRMQLAYGGTALVYGTQYRYVVKLWNRDDVPSSGFTGNLLHTPSESVGPTITVLIGGVYYAADLAVKVQTVTPTIRLANPAGGNIDQYRLRYYSPTGTLLFDSGTVGFTSAATKDVVTPALWDWGQNPMVDAAIRPTGNADLGPFSVQKTIHINTTPGAPYPPASLPREIQVITITGTPTGGTFTLTFLGQTTAAIAYNATAVQVGDALVALSNIDAADLIDRLGGPLPGSAVWMYFEGRYAGIDLAQMTAVGSLTGGTAPAVAVTTYQHGTPSVVRADGVLVFDDDQPILRFPFRDTDKDLGYVEVAVRREIELRNLADAHVGASPYVITTGITDDWTVPLSVLVVETSYKARARYDDNANVRSAFSDYMFIRRSAKPTLTSVTPADAAAITDPTPAIAWTFGSTGGKAQQDYRITATVASNLLYDSGWVAGAAATAIIPAGILPTGATVAWTLDVQDTDGLAATQIARTFTTTFTQPAALTGLVLTPNPGTLAIDAEWTASTLPTAEFEAYYVYARAGDGQYRLVATVTDQVRDEYLNAVLGTVPLAYWRLDETSGTVAADSSGNAHDAAYMLGPTLGVAGLLIADSNAAVDLDGVNDYLNVADGAWLDALDTGSFTLVALVRHDSFDSPSGGYLPFNKGSGTLASQPRVEIGEGHTSGSIQIELADGTNQVSTDLVLDFGRDDAWFLNRTVHMAVVINRTTNLVSVYLDGVKQTNEVNIATVTGSIGNASSLLLGYAGGWLINGKLDEPALFGRALTAEEIAALYTSASDPVRPSYAYKAAEHQSETILRVTQYNGFLESEPVEGSVILDVYGYWATDGSTIIELKYVEPGGFSATPVTSQEVFHPKGRSYAVVLDWGTYGVAGHISFAQPPEDDTLTQLRNWQKAGTVVLLKAPRASHYSKLTSLPETHRKGDFRDAGLDFTETGPDSATF